jgi:hypothetical protein
MEVSGPPTQRNSSPPVPGPSPWYLSSPSAQVHARDGTWTWIEDPKLAGICHLFSPRDEAVLTVDFYCYVQQLPHERLLIWHEEGRQQSNISPNPRVVFDLLTLTALVPVPDAESVAVNLRAKKNCVRFEGGCAARYEIVTSIEAGIHPITPPREFSELHEVLVLADFGPAELSSNHWDRMSRAIFAFNFQARQLEVMPQDWFNGGGYDYGYQWISRVYREPNRGRIFGEGVRLGRFRLDPSGRRVEEWLHDDRFYRPADE